MKSLLFKLEKRKQKENNLVLDGVAMLTGSLGEILTLRERTQFVLKKKKKIPVHSVLNREEDRLPPKPIEGFISFCKCWCIRSTCQYSATA